MIGPIPVPERLLSLDVLQGPDRIFPCIRHIFTVGCSVQAMGVAEPSC